MKAIYDIEAMPITGGFKYGELVVFAAGRRTGKTMLNQMFRPMEIQSNFKIQNQAQVDEVTWYTVFCRSYETAKWVRLQDRALWYEHIHKNWNVIHNTFDMHEKLYTMLALRWS
jgi:hypothetical protein